MTTTAIEPLLESAQEKLRSGKSIKITDLLEVLVPIERPIVPAKIPLPAEITEAQRTALERLPQVFGKVVPAERRALAPIEVDALLDEREVLKIIEKMVAERVSNIRLSVLNAHDVAVEEQLPKDEDRAEIYRDEDGHYHVKDKVHGSPASSTAFSVEPSAGSRGVSVAALQALSEDSDFEDFTHADFLAMTTPVRVFDENKTMLLLKKNPALLEVLRRCGTSTKPSVSVQPRKA